MRVTLLGHACVLVELDGARCLMDPLLRDPFEEGMVVSCPARSVDADRLPDLDILVVSHRHPDHFDVASLDRVDRDVEAICPGDPVIVRTLRELGFANVHPVAAMAPILGPGFELFPTRSELSSLPEMGMVFRDRTGVFWNQVDTLLSDDTIDAVRNRFGNVDVLFAMYASQNFEFFESRATGFPLDTHRRNVETALRIDPTVLVPASAGFRFCGEHEWLNAFLFPVSRERFAADVRRVAPTTDVRVVDPGDVFEISSDGRVDLHRAASTVVRTDTRDTWRIAFDPTSPIPPLTDPNPDDQPLGDVVARSVGTVDALAAWAAAPHAGNDRVARAYRDRGVRYRIGLVFPDGTRRRFDLDFGAPVPALTEVRDHDIGTDPDFVHWIAASALAGWADHTRSFFSVRAYSRRFRTAYELRRDDTGVVAEVLALPDLLMYYLVRVAEGSEVAALTEVEHQLRALRSAPRA